ncbi:LOW QUALITY PROTEIN: thiamine ABC transporter ATP-binding protein, partial [Rhodococcus opacus PD630]
ACNPDSFHRTIHSLHAFHGHLGGWDETRRHDAGRRRTPAHTRRRDRLQHRRETVRHGNRRTGRHRPRRPPRRLRRRGRTFGLREVDTAENGSRTGTSDRRIRGSGHRLRGVHLPGTHPAALADRTRQRGTLGRTRPGRRGGPEGTGGRGHRRRRTGRFRRPAAPVAVRRNEDARLARPRPDTRTRGDAARRTVRGTRRVDQARHAGRTPQPVQQEGVHVDVHHPLGVRGGVPRQPGRRHDRAARTDRLGHRHRLPSPAKPRTAIRPEVHRVRRPDLEQPAREHTMTEAPVLPRPIV